MVSCKHPLRFAHALTGNHGFMLFAIHVQAYGFNKYILFYNQHRVNGSVNLNTTKVDVILKVINRKANGHDKISCTTYIFSCFVTRHQQLLVASVSCPCIYTFMLFIYLRLIIIDCRLKYRFSKIIDINVGNKRAKIQNVSCLL